MPRIHFSGAEVGTHRKRFSSHGLRRVAFNLGPVLNSGGHSSVAQDDLVPFIVVFYASQTVNEDDAAEIMRKHGDDTSIAIGLEYSGRFPGTAVPVWNGVDVEDAIELMVTHGAVFVDEADALEKRNQYPLNNFVSRNPSVNVFCATSKVNALALPFITDAIIAGWLATQKHRELQVWDGKKVRKLPRTSRTSAVDSHLGQIHNLECDPQLLKEGDIDELVKLSFRSWRKYEEVIATPLPPPDAESALTPSSGVATTRIEPRQRERVLLPVLAAFEDGDVGAVIARPNVNSLRQCNGCFIAHACPGYEVDSLCKFNIPVEIRSKRQMADAQQLVHEIQMQRILFMRLAEEVAGGEPNPQLGREMDRLFRQAESVTRQSEHRATLTVTTTEQGSSGGILAQIFGNQIAGSSPELPKPIDSNEVFADSWEVDSNGDQPEEVVSGHVAPGTTMGSNTEETPDATSEEDSSEEG